jgi:PAS domain S-box-containing protein
MNEILHAENLLRAIDEMEDYAFFFLDINGIIQSWNKGAQKIKGYTSEEIIGKSFKCFYSTKDLENQVPDHLVEMALKNGKAFVEGWRIKKDGTPFWGSVLLMAIHNDKGETIGFGKLTRDLTDKKLVEQLTRDLTNQKIVEQLTEEYCQKLKQMLHMTSHRVRSPLARCLGLLSLIESESRLTEDELKLMINHLKSSANELNSFTEELTVYMSDLEKKYSHKL